MINDKETILLRTSNKFQFVASELKHDGKTFDAIDKVVDFDETPMVDHGHILLSLRSGIVMYSYQKDNKDIDTGILIDGTKNICGCDISFTPIDTVDVFVTIPTESMLMKYIQQLYDGVNITEVGQFMYSAMVEIHEENKKACEIFNKNIHEKINFYIELVNRYTGTKFSEIKKK